VGETRNPSDRIAGNSSEFRIGYLPNTSLERYHAPNYSALNSRDTTLNRVMCYSIADKINPEKLD
jgi:hypothetical protein